MEQQQKIAQRATDEPPLTAATGTSTSSPLFT